MRDGIPLASLSDPDNFGVVVLYRDEQGYYWKTSDPELAKTLDAMLPAGEGSGPIGVFPVRQIKRLKELLGTGETRVFGANIPEGEEGKIY